MKQALDALFVSYFEELDRYHNDHLPARSPVDPLYARVYAGEPEAWADAGLPARHAQQSVGIDGAPHDLRRFLSRARYGTTAEYRRYCAFAPNHLSGTYYRSLLARHGYRVHHVNCADRVVLAELAQRLEPRVVLLSTTFLNETTHVLAAIQAARRAFPQALLVLGGLILVEYQRSMDAATFERLLGAWGADVYVVSPEGEQALLGVLAADRGRLATLPLPKTYVRDGRRVVACPEAAEQSLSLDESYVRWELLEPESLYHTVHTRTARSCAFKCAFCSYFSTQGPLILAEPETLRRELESLSKVPGVRSLIFTDDTFNVPPTRFKELCRVLCDFDFEWYSFFRAQFADAETTRLMRDSGCKAVFLGIESIDDVVLKNMNKSATERAYRRGVGALKDAGIWLHANFIVGYPGDTETNVARTVAFLDEFEVEFFTPSPFYCSPGTPVWERRAELGIEGKYTHWRHATMDYVQANRLVRELTSAPRHTVFMSELTANCFWSELLFYANGFSPQELKLLLRAFNRRMGSDRSAASLALDSDWREVQQLLARREMPPPPDAATARAAVTAAG
jgi:radical SAM superfamily enzyme YgiQ (UPF0313 family)